MKTPRTALRIACSLLPTVALAQGLLEEVLPSSLNTAERLGWDVAMDSTHVVTGNPRYGPTGGRVLVYRRTPAGLVPDGELFGDSTGAEFGASVDLDRGRIVVGAAKLGNGRAYVYERVGAAWLMTALLTASDGTPGDRFGAAVSIDGNTIVVGAPNVGTTSFEGAAYFFEEINGTWTEVKKVWPSDATSEAHFGSAVAVSGEAAVVGAPFHGPLRRGAAWVYRRSTAGWTREARLEEANALQVEMWGTAVAIDGDRALITSTRTSTPTQVYLGAGLVFSRSAQGWQPEQRLEASNAQAGDHLGFSCDLLGDRILLGSPLAGSNQSGRAVVFDRTVTGWQETVRLEPPNNDRMFMGWSVALSCDTALLGAPLAGAAGTNSGAAYLFDADPGSQRYCPANTNSTGMPASLQVAGCRSVQANGLTLRATSVPDGTGLFFYGPGTTQRPLGDGFICVSGRIHRLPLQSASNGGFALEVDLTDPPTPAGLITAGSTWNFQAWYRDPASARANTSDAAAVTFRP